MFSTFNTFITKEIAAASNIKDRRNRKCVERILKIIAERIRGIKQIANGLYIFAGIDDREHEYIELVEPPNVNDRFIYRCSSKFYTDILSDLIKQTRKLQFLVLITGEETKIYQHDCGAFTLKQQITGNVVKRQKKGGQSSVRFSRLAEESRAMYVTRVVDKINNICRDSKHVLVFGARELKNDLMGSKKLCVRLKTMDMHHVIEPEFVQNNKKHLIELFENEQSDDHTKKIQDMCELINKDPDWLLFGLNEISSDVCEYAVGVVDESEVPLQNYIQVPRSSRYYSTVLLYKVIGKKYYK